MKQTITIQATLVLSLLLTLAGMAPVTAETRGSNGLLPADEFDIDGDGDTSEPLPLDLDGNERVVGSAVDLGPFEYDELLDLIFRNRFQN